jgi:hypothetical protein
MPDERKSPLAQALDVLLYAPLGLALSAREELPKLAEKGRQQAAVAKMIGHFAVTQGRQELEKRLTTMAAPRPAAAPPTPAPPAPAPPVAAAPPSTNGNNPTTRPAPPVESLAIPGYDSLSASQVVQRLAGLSGPELDQVAVYEEATRGRRTILSKVAMLQHDTP